MRAKYKWVGSGVLIVSLALVSCSESADDSEGGADEPISLTYEIWDPRMTDPITDLAEQYETDHPNISVKVVQTPFEQYWTRLQTALSGGNPPDVFHMNGPNFQLYAANGALMPLTELLDSGELDSSMYPDSLHETYTYGDEQYGIPINFSTIAMWYNEDIFDEADVEYPDENWSWQDVMDAAEEITDENTGVYGIAAGADPGAFAQEGYVNTIAQAGGSILSEQGTESTLGQSASIEGLQYWRDFLDAGVSPTYDEMLETPPSQMFQSGKVAMIYGGVWRAKQWHDSDMENVDVAPLPAGPNGSISSIHGIADVIAADTNHPDAARDFVEYLSSKDSQLAIAESGALLTAYEGTQDAWVQSMPEYDLNVYIDAMDTTVPLPVSQNTRAWQQDVDEALAAAWRGKVSVDEAATNAAEVIDAALAEEK